MKTVIHHYDNDLIIINPTEQIEKYLTAWKRTLVQNQRGYGRKPKMEKVLLYNVLYPGPTNRTIQTMQGFYLKTLQILAKSGELPEYYDHRVGFPEPRLDLMRGFRAGQEQLLTEFLQTDRSGALKAPTRYGKCFGAGTPIMMADGSIKAVEAVKTGDLVMGPDSKPRKVAGCTTGVDQMYCIKPNRGGMRWTCNAGHLLHVERTSTNSKGKRAKWDKGGLRENIPVEDFHTATKWYKHIRKQVSTAVDFPERKVLVDPYIYGVWLGDGHSSGVSFTNADQEIWNEIEQWAERSGLIESDHSEPQGQAVTRHWILNKGTGSTKRGTNKWRQFFRSRPKNEGIDNRYLRSSRDQRLQLLAGLIDSDGEVNNRKNLGLITKHQRLAKDVVYLCNTLGLPATYAPVTKKSQNGTEGIYYRVKIRGPVDLVPARLERKCCERQNYFSSHRIGFEIEPIGEGRYYGFALEDPEGLFLLGDCTIVHNTTLMANTLRAYPRVRKTVWAAPGVDLLQQTVDDLQQMLPERDITGIFTGSRQKRVSDDITICSFDSLHKVDVEGTRLLLVDEPHASVSEERAPLLARFKNTRILGFGATLSGRFDNMDKLIVGLIGPTWVEKSFKEGVAEGALSPIRVYRIPFPFEWQEFSSRDVMYRRLVHNNPQFVGVVNRLVTEVIPADWQTLTFVETKKQASFMLKQVPESELAIADLMTSKERKEMFTAMRENEIKRCICTKIYSTGVTFSDLRGIVNACGGGGSISSTQKPGRLAEIREGKKRGYLFDFMFECANPPPVGENLTENQDRYRAIEGECNKRFEEYRKLGYEIVDVKDIGEIQLD